MKKIAGFRIIPEKEYQKIVDNSWKLFDLYNSTHSSRKETFILIKSMIRMWRKNKDTKELDERLTIIEALIEKWDKPFTHGYTIPRD